MKYNLVTNFAGYFSKPELTNTAEKYLVSGSQNVLINEQEKIETREGYSIFGAQSSVTTATLSSFDWINSRGVEINTRFNNGTIEYYSATSSAWETLLGSLSTTNPIRATTWWNNTDRIDEMVFVNNSTTLYEWSGGTGTYASSTSTTIVINEVIANRNFLASGTRRIRVKDSGGTFREFTVASQTGSTFTVSEDPTAFTFATNAIVVQSVRANANTPSANFTNNLISVLNNQLFVGSETSRLIYISQNDSVTDYTFSSPRVNGEGALLTLDDSGVALVPQEGEMYVAAGESDWYKVVFQQITVSTTLTEQVNVKKLKNAPLLAPISQEMVTKIGNYVAFVSNEPALRLLGRVQNLEEPQFQSLSNPIKPDFDDENFTGGQITYHKNRIYISAPVNGKVYINETVEDASGQLRRFWQPPQILPFRAWMIRSGDLYGHANGTNETYLAFDGTNDDGNAMTARASLAYRSFGDRARYKRFDEHYTEGYISSNTTITCTFNYEFTGAGQQLQKSILGTSTSTLFQSTDSNVLGDNPLGEEALGVEADSTVRQKFRIIHVLPKFDFFEYQAIYESDSIDQQWEILATGPNIELSSSRSIIIKS